MCVPWPGLKRNPVKARQPVKFDRGDQPFWPNKES